MNNKTIKEKYLSPTIEVIEVENEGVIALSDFTGGNPALPGRNIYIQLRTKEGDCPPPPHLSLQRQADYFCLLRLDC